LITKPEQICLKPLDKSRYAFICVFFFFFYLIKRYCLQ